MLSMHLLIKEHKKHQALSLSHITVFAFQPMQRSQRVQIKERNTIIFSTAMMTPGLPFNVWLLPLPLPHHAIDAVNSNAIKGKMFKQLQQQSLLVLHILLLKLPLNLIVELFLITCTIHCHCQCQYQEEEFDQMSVTTIATGLPLPPLLFLPLKVMLLVGLLPLPIKQHMKLLEKQHLHMTFNCY